MRKWPGLRALIDSPLNCAITLACLPVACWIGLGVLRWAVLDAAFSGGPRACRAAAGACWPYLSAKIEFFLFGYYPAALRWRPALSLLVLLGLLGLTLRPRFWTWRLLAAWPAALVIVVWLMGGGLGLHPVPSDEWSGLPLTLLITSFALPFSFVIGVFLALGRTSLLPFFRMVCTGFIELQRGLPLVSVLFMASVMLPLLLPAGATPGKLLRAYLAFTLITSAFVAEVVRGGFRAVPAGQAEAAAALGLGYWRTLCLIVLPQCLRVSIPPLVTVAISLLKDTTLITVIGLTDLLGTVSSGGRDPAWLGYDVEGYAFAALVYFALSLGASRYAAWLERRTQGGTWKAAA